MYNRLNCELFLGSVLLVLTGEFEPVWRRMDHKSGASWCWGSGEADGFRQVLPRRRCQALSLSLLFCKSIHWLPAIWRRKITSQIFLFVSMNEIWRSLSPSLLSVLVEENTNNNNKRWNSDWIDLFYQSFVSFLFLISLLTWAKTINLPNLTRDFKNRENNGIVPLTRPGHRISKTRSPTATQNNIKLNPWKNLSLASSP